MNPNIPFRDKETALKVSQSIKKEADIHKTYKIMEVCGTHTMAIARSGLKSMLPENVELISGPGCPVCVTSQGEIDLFFELLDCGVSVASFGDLLCIPGSNGETLIDKRARGADVNVVYSPLDTLKLAEDNPDKHYTFLGIGFETTAPTIAALIMEAKEKGLKNLSVLSFCKTMPAAFDLILSDKDMYLDGFLCPGHVTAVTGVQLYEPLIKAGKAAVVAGFEPVEMLDAVYEIVKQANNKDFHIVNKYRRVVPDIGNANAREILSKVFYESDAFWRGLGELKKSGLAIRQEYIEYDALKRFDLKPKNITEIKGCKCGQVLTGKIKPQDCPLFAKRCTPEDPVGPCMVSGEGTCAAYYKFLR